MGNIQSLNPAHARIYQNLLNIQSVRTRYEMIQTLLAGQEYVHSFRQAGIYSHMLQYCSKVQRGENPGVLPYEQSQQQQSYSLTLQPQQNQQNHRQPLDRLTKNNSNEKALGYFQICLQVLGLEEEVALTEQELKKAYKRAAMKSHPDKGGSEKAFEGVTRAYAYLSEILKRIQGGRAGPLKEVQAPTLLQTERKKDAEVFKQVEPVRLNPNKLDLSAFNQMFEQTRVPDPDEDGYGDWLKNESGSDKKTQAFSGKFNRDVFNTMFEKEATSVRDVRQTNALTVVSPQALMLAPNYGVELGRDRPTDYTAAANSSVGLKFTDLKSAYTTESTFSGQVADVHVDKRDFNSYQENRKRAPDPLRNEEVEALAAMEKEQEEREKRRQVRAAQEHMVANDYHERMKRLVITDGVPLERHRRS